MRTKEERDEWVAKFTGMKLDVVEGDERCRNTRPSSTSRACKHNLDIAVRHKLVRSRSTSNAMIWKP